MKIDVDAINYDEFIVLDSSDNPVTGLVDGDFTRKLFDPDDDEVANISAGVPVSIEEVGSGVYRVSFVPNKIGNWVLIVYNLTHFPWGKGNSYECVEYVADEIGNMLQRILGLSQENYRVINPQYDRLQNLTKGTIKIYPTALDCENDTNPIAVYEITATYDKQKMTGYKTKRIS